MDRRRFIAGSVAVFAAPGVAEAQQTRKVPRIGVLNIAPRSGPFFHALDQRLRELGHVEGQTVAIEFRTAEGRVEKLAGLATELVGLKVDVIVTPTEPAARAAKEATSTIPIVMAGINYDPIALGYVATLARPGGNVTGVFFRHIELTAKRLELFKEMVPTVKRVAVFSDPLTIDQLRAVEAANTRIHFRLQPLELRRSPYDFRSAFGIAMRSHAEALFVLESSPIFRERMQITQLALKNRLPTSFAFREYIEAGGLMAYGASFVDMAGLAAVYVDKILKGAKPADLPTEQPTKFELVINLKTAKALGPPSRQRCCSGLTRSSSDGLSRCRRFQTETPPSFQAQAGVFLPFAIVVSGLYLLLGLRYWFRRPIVGTALSGVCFVASWVLFVMGG